MRFSCRGENCRKDFSSKTNRNKHERIHKHYRTEKKSRIYIPFSDKSKLYSCPSEGCVTTSTRRNNIMKNLKSCYKIQQNRIRNSINKVCYICVKELNKKCKRDRHIRDIHASECSNDKSFTEVENFENYVEKWRWGGWLPTLVSEEQAVPVVSLNQQEAESQYRDSVTPPRDHVVPGQSSSTEVYLNSSVRSQIAFPVFLSKVCLETVTKNLKTQLDYTQ